MPFDSSEALAVIKREDGLYEKDTFDISTAVPVPEFKVDTSRPEFKAESVRKEESARAVVELAYKDAGEGLPLKRKIDWALTSESAQAAVGAIAMTAFTRGLFPVVQAFKGVGETLAGDTELPLDQRIMRNIFHPEEAVSLVEKVPGYKGLPAWAKITASLGEDILLYTGAGVAKGRAKVELFKKKIVKAENTYVEENLGKVPKMKGTATREEIGVMQKAEQLRQRFRGMLQQEFSTITQEGKTVAQEAFEKRNIMSMLVDDLRSLGVSGQVKIGQSVMFESSTQGLMKGVVKAIEGNRVTIDMAGRQIVASLSQLRIPEIPKELKSVVPKAKVKGIVRKATGQVKVGDVIKESDALKRLFKREEQISKEFQRDYDKAMVKELEREQMAINKYERDIGKLERQIDKGEFKTEVEKIRGQERLEKLKMKYAEAKEIGKQREAMRKEVSDAVSFIKKQPSENIAVEYQDLINKIKQKFDLKGRTQKTLSRRESMKAFVARMGQEGLPVQIPPKKLAMLDKVLLEDMTIDQLREIKDTVAQLAQLGKTKIKARTAVYEAKKGKITKELVPQVKAINEREIPDTPIGSTPNKAAERYIKMLNWASKTRVGLTPMEGLADVTGMQSVKKVVDANFKKYLEFNDKTMDEWYKITQTFNQGNFDRIGVHAIRQQEGGAERLMSSGRTQTEIDAVKLTAEEMKAYDFMRDTFDKHFPQIKQYTKEVYNEDVGEVENYVSFMADNDAMNNLAMYDRFGSRPEGAVEHLTKTVEQGFRKQRAKTAEYRVLTNADRIFRRHMDDVAYMLTMGRDVKMYYEVINSPEMRKALGDLGTLSWLQYMDLLARKGGSEGAKRIAALDIVRRNLGAGYLGLRLSSALVQFSSFGDAVATIGIEWASRGAYNLVNEEWRSFIIDNFPEVRKAVGDDIAFREFGEDWFGKTQRWGMTPLQAMDGLMRVSAASGAYEKIAFERGIKVDLKNPDQDIIAEATKLMRQSQGSSFFKDQPLSITTDFGLAENKSVNKALLTFQSFMLGRWDNINRQVWRLGIKEKDYKKAISSLTWLVIFGLMGEEALRRTARAITNIGVKKDDRYKEKSFASGVALNAIQAVPLLGQLVSAITYASNPVVVMNAMNDFFEGLGTTVKGKTATTKARGAVQAIGSLAAGLGVTGSGQISQIIRARMKPKKKYTVK